ncbi:OsmC family protein [Flavobacterium sp. LB2P6]|uniref:OsmC family protein n=1 Tax=Flavobacterium sp. LB2P6 TaxID=3401714 RepID=UPI003AAB12C9
MIQIKAHIDTELYKTELESATNTIIYNEPESAGGKDLGFAPKEILASALVAVFASPYACMQTEKNGI